MTVEEAITQITESGILKIELDKPNVKRNIFLGDHLDEVNLYMDQASMLAFALKLIQCAMDKTIMDASSIFSVIGIIDLNTVSVMEENLSCEELSSRYSYND
jgi:hypothetical protein